MGPQGSVTLQKEFDSVSSCFIIADLSPQSSVAVEHALCLVQGYFSWFTRGNEGLKCCGLYNLFFKLLGEKQKGNAKNSLLVSSHKTQMSNFVEVFMYTSVSNQHATDYKIY